MFLDLSHESEYFIANAFNDVLRVQYSTVRYRTVRPYGTVT